MTDQKRQGTSKSGWCLDSHHDGCWLETCPCDCGHEHRNQACQGRPFKGCTDCKSKGGEG